MNMLFGKSPHDYKPGTIKVGQRVVMPFIDIENNFNDVLMCTVTKIDGDSCDIELNGDWVDVVTNKVYPKGYKLKAKIPNLKIVD